MSVPKKCYYPDQLLNQTKASLAEQNNEFYLNDFFEIWQCDELF